MQFYARKCVGFRNTLHQCRLPPRDEWYTRQLHRFVSEKELPQILLRLLKSGYAIRCPASGRSMSPLIEPGDWLTVEPVPLKSLHVGDIAVYSSEDHEGPLTTHRVVRVAHSGARPFIETRSDAEGLAGDGDPIAAGRIYGRVVRVERNGRTRWRAGALQIKAKGFLISARRLAGQLWRSVRSRDASPTDRLNGYCQASQVIFESSAGGGWLVPMRSGVLDAEHIYELNGTGAFLWNELGRPRTLSELTQLLDDSRALQDLPQWLKKMQELGFVEEFRAIRA